MKTKYYYTFALRNNNLSKYWNSKNLTEVADSHLMGKFFWFCAFRSEFYSH